MVVVKSEMMMSLSRMEDISDAVSSGDYDADAGDLVNYSKLLVCQFFMQRLLGFIEIGKLSSFI